MNIGAGTSFSRGLCVVLLIAAAVALSTPSAVLAQAVSGTILGTVTDATGAVIGNAKVTVINEGTGLTRTVQADGNGTGIRCSFVCVTEMVVFKVAASVIW